MSSTTISSLTTINAQKSNPRHISSPRCFQGAATIAPAKTAILDLELTSLNLQELCLDVIEEIEERFKSSISISFNFKGNISNMCLNKRLILPILINLLDNAVKYSQGTKGKVDLAVIVNANVANFIIQDQGIGIPVADQAHVFDSFYRGTNTDKIQGSGIGLTVVKRCVDLYAGKISFQSILGQGSKFTVSIPLAV
ncbi:MAG: sensor histidine kinase [Waterburya sp.]